MQAWHLSRLQSKQLLRIPGTLGAAMLLIISGQGNLPGVKLGDALEGIDLYNRFVRAKSQSRFRGAATSECC